MEEENNTDSIPSRIKNHFVRNKFAYAAGAVAITALAWQQKQTKAFYGFLESRNIEPMEYYNPEWYAELNDQ